MLDADALALPTRMGPTDRAADRHPARGRTGAPAGFRWRLYGVEQAIAALKPGAGGNMVIVAKGATTT
ncbi:hypothetical protein [Novosphingobium sp.]|uniref:hypothetical protein n=1 Tax=Novosphingobium sp. TaxID=1874826 RepID=UPI001ED40C33|nr:hypothetical protein [Novosphingobium sp.]MBK9010386.1 hypothetical protein [Novosphingobium sp.]